MNKSDRIFRAKKCQQAAKSARNYSHPVITRINSQIKFKPRRLSLKKKTCLDNYLDYLCVQATLSRHFKRNLFLIRNGGDDDNLVELIHKRVDLLRERNRSLAIAREFRAFNYQVVTVLRRVASRWPNSSSSKDHLTTWQRKKADRVRRSSSSESLLLNKQENSNPVYDMFEEFMSARCIDLQISTDCWTRMPMPPVQNSTVKFTTFREQRMQMRTASASVINTAGCLDEQGQYGLCSSSARKSRPSGSDVLLLPLIKLKCNRSLIPSSSSSHSYLYPSSASTSTSLSSVPTSSKHQFLTMLRITTFNT
jgi:hypothetical protein